MLSDSLSMLLLATMRQQKRELLKIPTDTNTQRIKYQHTANLSGIKVQENSFFDNLYEVIYTWVLCETEKCWWLKWTKFIQARSYLSKNPIVSNLAMQFSCKLSVSWIEIVPIYAGNALIMHDIRFSNVGKDWTTVMVLRATNAAPVSEF